jgi:S-DNA-T family DNA segregation ATPase FtsK/SpoIIIE
MIMVDPKMLELSIYEGIPHLLAPVVTDMRQAANALSWCVAEMEKRYKIMATLGVRNIAGCNAKIKEAQKSGTPVTNPLSLTPEAPEPLNTMPHIVVVVDEFADLIMVAGKEVEAAVARLAQKARAAGIHVILATQRPSVDVITGMIKANFPARIAFKVSQKVDSRTILDKQGAEHLLGMGDMLILPPGSSDLRRVHCAFVSEDEVERVAEHWRAQGKPTYDEDILRPREEDDDSGTPAEDEIRVPMDKYEKAVQLIIAAQRCSTSMIQRHLCIGYNVAARIVDKMEREGIVGPPKGPGKDREVLA